MKAQLKVLGGSHAGKCITLAGQQFVIGRGEDCNLRSSSDAVSRRHCQINLKGSAVSVQDLGSRNGTFVNDQPILGEQALKTGDQLTIGPLKFEVLLTEAQPKSGAPPVPAQRPEENSGGKWNDDSVSQWLDEADATERTQRLAGPDTRIFKFDETAAVDGAKAAGLKGKKVPPPKKPPAKLPQKKDNSKDSQEAAAQMLRRLFNRGPS